MPRTRRAPRFAAFAFVALTLATGTPALARWPAGVKETLRLTPQASGTGMVDACADGAGGAYFAWGSGQPAFASCLQHIDAFGEDVFAGGTWSADTVVGSILHVAPIDAGAVALLSRTTPAGGSGATLLLTRIEAHGARSWTTPLWTGTWNGDWDWLRIVRDPAGRGVVVAWLDGAQMPYAIRVQRVERDGSLSWSAPGVVAYSGANARLQGLEPDGAGGAWIALRCDSMPGQLRVQHVRADGSVTSPSGALVELNAGAWQIANDGGGGVYVSYMHDTNMDGQIQRVRGDGSLAFGPLGVVPPGTYASTFRVPSLGAAADGRVFVAWQSPESPWTTRVNVLDSTGTWAWPGSGVACSRTFAEGLGTRVYANADGGATITVQPASYVMGALSGAQRFTLDGTMLWPDPPPTLIVLQEWEQAYNSLMEGWYTVPTGDGGVMHFFTLADSGSGSVSSAYAVRAQHLDAYGRRGDTSPRIVSARDVPNDVGGWIEVRWAASCLEGDATMATSGYDVLRESPDGSWSAVTHVAASGASEYVATVPTLADSTSPASPRAVVRVRATDASARTWTSPSDSASSYANSPPLAVDAASARALALDPPSPSPANATVWLRFAVPGRGRVTLHVYDAAGRRVRRLVDAEYPAGPASTRFPLADDAERRLAPGIYVVRPEAGGVSRSRRLVVLH